MCGGINKLNKNLDVTKNDCKLNKTKQKTKHTKVNQTKRLYIIYSELVYNLNSRSEQKLWSFIFDLILPH